MNHHASHQRSVTAALLSVALCSLITLSPHPAATAETPTSFLDRPESGDFTLRVLNWNVWLNSIFPPSGPRRDSFERILRAVRPDLLCLQEIGPDRAGELAGILDLLLPLEHDRRWQVHFAPNGDNAVVSRYPLRRPAHEAVTPLFPNAFQLPDFHLGHVMCLVDLPDAPNRPDLYLFAAHFRSRGGEANTRARQIHADTLVRSLRRLRDASSPDALSTGTPILIVGDLNVYESDPTEIGHHLTTLLTGNIVDEAAFGPDLAPDWDGTHLLEVKPRHNGRGKDWYTWRVDSDRFPPGALDRMLYTDSVLKVRRSFVLNTTEMTPAELQQSGLLATDVLRVGKPGDFDHLPMVADFEFPAPASAKTGPSPNSSPPSP